MAALYLKLLGASLLVPAASVPNPDDAALCRQPSRAAVALDEVPAASVPNPDDAALCRQPSRAAVALDEAQTGGPGGSISMVQSKRASLQVEPTDEASQARTGGPEGSVSILVPVSTDAIAGRIQGPIRKMDQGKRAPVRVQPTDEASQAKRLAKAYPIAWVHPPKSGSSILNFMVHLPGTCPGMPNDTVVSVAEYGERFNHAFRERWRTVTPDGSGACEDHFFKWGDHPGAGPDWDTHYKGRAFAMFRQPEQRLLSAYSYNYHSWPRILPPRNELEMAEVLQGCAVRMLTRGGWNEVQSCGGALGGPTAPEEVVVASRRLRTDFAFVGLTDYWVLSMCLGHRMFGGSCRESDFMADRVTKRKRGGPSGDKLRLQPNPYDTAPLKGFHDPYDGALYEVAQEVFRRELRLYNVSLESCRPCFEEAGISELVTPEMEFAPSA